VKENVLFPMIGFVLGVIHLYFLKKNPEFICELFNLVNWLWRDVDKKTKLGTLMFFNICWLLYTTIALIFGFASRN
jgi:hypothetical protein